MMKWLIISCALIFNSVSLISAVSEEESVEDNKCYQEFMNHSKAETECVKEHLNINEFEIELNGTIDASSEDPNAVRTFGEKYCPKLNNSIYCLRIGFNLSADCLDDMDIPLKQQEIIFQTDILAKVLAYACENDGAVLVRLAPHRGFVAILKKFGSCFKLNDTRFSDPNSATFRVNPLYCDSVSKSVDCYVDHLRNHKNQELVPFANEVHALVRELLKCQ